MKRVAQKLFIAGMLAALAGLGQAYAETGQGDAQGQTPKQGMMGKGQMHKGGPGERLRYMARKLQLTEEQKGQIKPILQDEFKQMKALREDTSLSREQKREKMQDIHNAAYEKIKPILTPEQQKKHDEMRRKAMEQREDMRKKKGAEPPPSAQQ